MEPIPHNNREFGRCATQHTKTLKNQLVYMKKVHRATGFYAAYHDGQGLLYEPSNGLSNQLKLKVNTLMF